MYSDVDRKNKVKEEVHILMEVMEESYNEATGRKPVIRELEVGLVRKWK